LKRADEEMVFVALAHQATMSETVDIEVLRQ